MTAIARARRVAQRSRLSSGAVELTDADVEPDDDRDEPPDTSGVVRGTVFDWREELYLDPKTGALYDRGDLEARNIRDMLKIDHRARTLYEILTSPIRRATWKLKPGEGDSGEAQDTEEKLRRPANAGGMSTPIDLVVGQMCSASAYRRAYFAKGFTLDAKAGDQSVMYSQLAMRPATTCRLLRDPKDGGFAGFEQDIAIYGTGAGTHGWDGLPVAFKPKQAMVFIHGMDREPLTGYSDLDVAYWCWQTKKKLIFLWYNFLEGQALPRTLVKHQGDEDQAKQAARRIARLGSSGVGYYDGNNMSIDTLDVSGKGPSSFVEAVKYLDQCASQSVNGGFVDLTSAAAGGGGSYALSKDSSDFFLSSRELFSGEIGTCLTSYAVADLVRYNYGPRGVCPTWVFDPLAEEEQGPVLTLLQSTASSRVEPLPLEFTDQLAIEASRLLHLDVDKVRAALEKAAGEAEKRAQLAYEQAEAGVGHQSAMPALPPAAAGVGAAIKQTGKIAASVAAAP